MQKREVKVNIDTFTEWLETHANLKEYSIGRYSRAINTITSELDNYGLPKLNLFDVTDTAFIDDILDNHEFQKKNSKGNRMYSTALKYFKRYMEYVNDKNFKAELFKDELEYEHKIIKNLTNKHPKADIVDEVQDKPNHRTVKNQKLWSRNSKYASDAVIYADYLCEFDNQHQHFISKYSQKNYVEAHHLIPMKYQEQFQCSLDVHANIVSLCMVCHKKLHYGLFNEKKEILDKLFRSRRNRFIKSGIDISNTKLYSYYKD